MTTENVVLSIKDALEFLRSDDNSEALLDCLNAIDLSKTALEGHFTTWLWLADGAEYDTEEDEKYAVTLGHIEEYLVQEGLIYN